MDPKILYIVALVMFLIVTIQDRNELNKEVKAHAADLNALNICLVEAEWDETRIDKCRGMLQLMTAKSVGPKG